VSAPFPPVAELIPHAGPMRLVESVLAHEPDATRCLVDPSRSALFRDGGALVPVWVGLEYMAQCVAVHAGLRARARGEALRPGLFLGSRRVRFRCAGFAPALPLEVTARHAAGRGATLAFDCAVHDPDGGAPLVEARLTVRALTDPAEAAP